MKTKLALFFLIGCVAGYFAGREHLKYELRSAATTAAQSIQRSIQKVFGSTNDVADSNVVNPFAAFAEASNRRDAARAQMEASKKKAAHEYSDFVVFTNVTANLERNYHGHMVPVIRGEMKNLGTRTIKELAATVYYQDASGKDIFEDDFFPVHESGLRDSGPLKPNYGCKIFATVEDFPSGWAEGKIRIALKEIEFEGESQASQ